MPRPKTRPAQPERIPAPDTALVGRGVLIAQTSEPVTALKPGGKHVVALTARAFTGILISTCHPRGLQVGSLLRQDWVMCINNPLRVR